MPCGSFPRPREVMAGLDDMDDLDDGFHVLEF
jgi:hypothetical protein